MTPSGSSHWALPVFQTPTIARPLPHVDAPHQHADPSRLRSCSVHRGGTAGVSTPG